MDLNHTEPAAPGQARCRNCGHYQRAYDQELAGEFGKCTFLQDDVWYPPDQTSCANFRKLTPGQRRHAERTVWFLFGIVLLLPLGMVLWGFLGQEINAAATILFFPLPAVFLLAGWVYWRWRRTRR